MVLLNYIPAQLTLLYDTCRQQESSINSEEAKCPEILSSTAGEHS